MNGTPSRNLSEARRKGARGAFGPVFVNELLILGFGLLAVLGVLLIPRGGADAIGAGGGGLGLFWDALAKQDPTSRYLLQSGVTKILHGSIYTLGLTLLGTTLCVVLALLVSIARQVRGGGGGLPRPARLYRVLPPES